MKSKLLNIIILTSIFGAISGFLGGIAFNYYNFSFLGFPFSRDIDVNGDIGNNPNIIIQEPKNVVIEQDDRLAEISSTVTKSQVEVFDKKSSQNYNQLTGKKNATSTNSFYTRDKMIGEGIILSNDGWVLIKFNKDLPNVNLSEKYIINNFVILNNDKIYTIEEARQDSISDAYYIKISSVDLPVIKFSSFKDVVNGQSLVGFNSELAISKDSVLKKERVISNNLLINPLKIENIDLEKAASNFNFYYNFEGELACVRKDSDCIPVNYFMTDIKNLFLDKEIGRPNLGFEYIELSQLLFEKKQTETTKKGALITKIDKDFAKLNLLEIGDIILSINGRLIDNDNFFSEILIDYSIGDKIVFDIQRNAEEIEVTLTLNK